jgi:glycosyltransferase involved in cell wall biosynthesis
MIFNYRMSLRDVKTFKDVTMKGVCIICPDMRGVGGIQSYARSVLDWVREAHPERPVYLIDPRGATAESTLLRLPLALIRLTWLVALGRVEVAHIQVSERMSFLRKGVLTAVAKSYGLRVVLHHHGAELAPFYGRRSAAGRWMLRRVFAMADRNLVLGEQWARLLIEEGGVAPERVEVLWNGVARAPRAEPSLRIGGMHVLFLAVMTPRKGPMVLLEALKILRLRGVDVTATIAGGGPLLDHCRSETRRLELDDRVALTGWVGPEEGRALMGRADVFALPSFHEGLPIAILEALRAGLPVVSTPVGAIPEAAPEGRGVVYAPMGDPVALADRLEDLAAHPLKLKGLAREGRRLFEERFTLDGHMARLMEIYGWAERKELAHVAQAA